MAISLDPDHLIDCDQCHRVAYAIDEHRATFCPFPGKDANENQLAAWKEAADSAPPLSLPPDDFDHFTGRCCDGRPAFGNVRLLRGGTA